MINSVSFRFQTLFDEVYRSTYREDKVEYIQNRRQLTGHTCGRSQNLLCFNSTSLTMKMEESNHTDSNRRTSSILTMTIVFVILSSLILTTSAGRSRHLCRFNRRVGACIDVNAGNLFHLLRGRSSCSSKGGRCQRVYGRRKLCHCVFPEYDF